MGNLGRKESRQIKADNGIAPKYIHMCIYRWETKTNF